MGITSLPLLGTFDPLFMVLGFLVVVVVGGAIFLVLAWGFFLADFHDSQCFHVAC